MGEHDPPFGERDPRRLAEELHRTRAELAVARGETAAARARAEAAEGSAAILSDLAAAPGALWVAEAESGRGVYISPGVSELLGVAPEQVLPDAGRWLGRVHPDDRAAVVGRFETLCRGEAAEVTYRVLPPSEGGSGALGRPAARWVSDLGFPITDAHGRVRRVAGFARPAGGEGGEEGLRRLLLAELNHRVRNALAAVQSVATSTARNAADAGTFWEAFAGRLRAMARAHDVVAGRGWTEGADLRALLEVELAPFLHTSGVDGPRAEVDGPSVRRRPLRWHSPCTSSRPTRPATARSPSARDACGCGGRSCLQHPPAPRPRHYSGSTGWSREGHPRPPRPGGGVSAPACCRVPCRHSSAAGCRSASSHQGCMRSSRRWCRGPASQPMRLRLATRVHVTLDKCGNRGRARNIGS